MGQHTIYTDTNSDRANRMAKAYPGSINLVSGSVPEGGEATVRATMIAQANTILKPATLVKGNYMFPNGADMRYTGGPGVEEPKIKTKNGDLKSYSEVPGAPLNRFMPNVASPGAGASGSEADELGTVNFNPPAPPASNNQNDPLVKEFNKFDPGSENQKTPGETVKIFTID
jgi:hypothetical protein